MKETSLQTIISHRVPGWRDEGKLLVYHDKIPELQLLTVNGMTSGRKNKFYKEKNLRLLRVLLPCWKPEDSGVTSIQFTSVQLLSRVWLFATPWIAASQASLSMTNSRSLLKLMSIELVMPSNHLILCLPFLLPSVFPSIRVFSNESALRIRWPKYWSFQLQHQSFQWIPRTDLL